MARRPSHPEPDDELDTPDKPPKPPKPGEPDQGPVEPPVAAPPVTTIADEQRARSREIAAMGVEKWKAEHDERTEEEKAGKQVPGVAAPAPEGRSWEGSSRTTPAARAAQNPAAPR